MSKKFHQIWSLLKFLDPGPAVFSQISMIFGDFFEFDFFGSNSPRNVLIKETNIFIIYVKDNFASMLVSTVEYLH